MLTIEKATKEMMEVGMMRTRRIGNACSKLAFLQDCDPEAVLVGWSGSVMRTELTRGGLSRTKECAAWSGMLDRCHNPKERSYHRYGARGIRVYLEWHRPDGFERFITHIGNMPSPGLTLDRTDNSRGYEPGNVRWATRQEQARNQRRNRLITAFGKTQCL